MMNYRKVNDIVGWIAFAIALIVYWMTAAPTASFWDCGEFISCANELQVPHPPGPPIYLLVGRLFAMFSFGNPENVAFMVNLVSVFSGAFTVLFIFWTITMLAKKIVAVSVENPEPSRTILIMFAGIVGALACTFSDSVWFNTVEAEVYAVSGLCTAAVVWLIFKWDARADQPDHAKWLVMIAFVIGLSIGIHLLNLLAIPALAFVYYFRKYKFTWKGAVVTFGISVIVLGLVQKGVIQWSVEIIWIFEKWLVGYETLHPLDGKVIQTGLGMPVTSGVYATLILLAAVFAGGLYFTHSKMRKTASAKIKERLQILNVSLASLMVVYIGYSTYLVIGIRANANVPLNENAPSHVVAMLEYMQRKQYGDWPILKGPLYNVQAEFYNNQYDYRNWIVQGGKSMLKFSEPTWFPMSDGTYELTDGAKINVKNGAVSPPPKRSFTTYLKEDSIKVSFDSKTRVIKEYRVSDRYVWTVTEDANTGYTSDIEYPADKEVFFPRMHSSGHFDEESNNFGYRMFVKNRFDRYKRPDEGDDAGKDKPTKWEDTKYFFTYQLNHMYWRYFMWNFAGRAGDEQDDDFETGLKFWETVDMPNAIRDNPGKNHYYALPLLLGLLGAVWHFFARRKDATTVLMLFFFTGIAIIIYLNQTPQQPRERDYSYAGSFQTFCIWIGLGVVALHDLALPYLKRQAHWIVGGATFFLVPGIMAVQNWDDHTRHVQYIPPDSAKNLLDSCDKNAILFTNGDNDTFPLWYVQEVENYRSDVRVVNLSLLNTDWYIDQMRMQANESPPLPISLKQSDYYGDYNNTMMFDYEIPAGYQWDKKDQASFDPPIEFAVDINQMIKAGVIREDQRDIAIDKISWRIPGQKGPVKAGNGMKARIRLVKRDRLIVDLIQTNLNNGWDRPIYFSSTIPPRSYLNLQPWFQNEGLAYRIAPLKPQFRYSSERELRYGGRYDNEKSFNRYMNVFQYRELDNPSLYADDHIRRTILGNLQASILKCADQFLNDADQMKSQNSTIQKNLAAMDTAKNVPDTILAMRDSLEIVVSKNEKKIPLYTLKADSLLDHMQAKMPNKIVPWNPHLLASVAETYNRMKDAAGTDSAAANSYEEKARAIFMTLYDESFPVLVYHNKKKSTGTEFPGEDYHRAAMDRLHANLFQLGEYQKAIEVASEMQKRFAFSPIYDAKTEEGRQKNQQIQRQMDVTIQQYTAAMGADTGTSETPPGTGSAPPNP